MISTLFGNGRPVLVIGGGFSGLSVAHHLANAGFDVELRESGARVGGLISTLETPYGPVETAANGLLNSPLVEDLFRTAGVQMRGTSRAARSRFIFRNGQPRRWPLTPLESLAVLPFALRFVLSRESLRPRAKETVREWGRRALSSGTSLYSIETALQGIYAGDPEKMSASLILGDHFESSQSEKPILRFKGTVSPVGGMGRLMDGLKQSLSNRGVRIELRSAVVADDIRGLGRPVVIATGADRAQALLEPLDRERAAALHAIENLPLVTIGAHFPKGSSPWRGFGCLFPPGEAKVLGVLWNNFIFDQDGDFPADLLSETWILGGALFTKQNGRSILDFSDDELLELVRAERRRVAGRESGPTHFRITRWPRALPHFTVAMEELVPRFRENRGNIFLLGNFTGGIGLSKILDQAAGLPLEIAKNGTWL